MAAGTGSSQPTYEGLKLRHLGLDALSFLEFPAYL